MLQGRLTDKHFAAQLDQVVANAAGYESYADAAEFFELTYPTQGLRDLLDSTFARLSGLPRASGGGGGHQPGSRLNTPSSDTRPASGVARLTG